MSHSLAIKLPRAPKLALLLGLALKLPNSPVTAPSLQPTIIQAAVDVTTVALSAIAVVKLDTSLVTALAPVGTAMEAVDVADAVDMVGIGEIGEIGIGVETERMVVVDHAATPHLVGATRRPGHISRECVQGAKCYNCSGTVTFPVIAPVQSKPRPTEAVTPSPSRPSFHSFGGRVDVSVESCSRPVLSSPYDDQASYGSTFPFFCPSHMCFMYVLISDTVSRHRVKIRST
ncbi:hypothetical protein FRC16_004325 [Serendipita sp. 398]|nr:hypothetical protein FRC16_004325 [Serendipita sp. 398]